MTSPSRRPLHVLVVDDYADNRQMYAKYLRYKGLEVSEAADGREALDRALDGRPDVIVMDLSLPGMDGWEATRELKGNPRTRDVPIVVVTGHALGGAAQSAKAAGCDSFLTKPCPPDALLEEIERVAGGRGDPDVEPRR